MIRHRIETLESKKLVGMKMTMTLTENMTPQLWRRFMERRNEVTNRMSSDLISMQLYSEDINFTNFNMETQFEKWACAEVSDFNHIPDGMHAFDLTSGLYAVFLHKGSAAAGADTFKYIFAEWLPSSDFTIDSRPHFEVLGGKYMNNDPNSEEDIWIPIKPR